MLRGFKHLNWEGGQDATDSFSAGPTDGTARPDTSLRPVAIPCSRHTHPHTQLSQVHADPDCGETRTLATQAPGA